jgi:hypothetical protein
VTVLGRERKEREGLVKVLLSPDCSDPVGVAVGEKVLGVRVTPVGQSFEQDRRLLDERVALLLEVDL